MSIKLLSILFAMLLSFASFAQSAQQCAGTTKKGERCHRMAAKGSQYCYQHQPGAFHCGATTKAGQPCQRIVKTAGAHCPMHSK